MCVTTCLDVSSSPSCLATLSRARYAAHASEHLYPMLLESCIIRCLHQATSSEVVRSYTCLQVSLDDHAFNKQQTLRYVKGYAHEAPEMTVQDPRVPSGLTDVYRCGGYNPATYTSSPTYSSVKKEETLPDWVVNNNKVSTLKHPA